MPRGHHLERLVRTLGQLPHANIPSLLLSGGTILGLVVALVVQTRRPSALWPRTATLALTVIGTLLTWGLKLDEKGVDTLGVRDPLLMNSVTALIFTRLGLASCGRYSTWGCQPSPSHRSCARCARLSSSFSCRR